jgi:hypothetical protein
MAIKHLLDTKTVNLNEVLSNGKIYRVPAYQRDYSWERDQWEDLWHDILAAEQAGRPHYMGSVVLQSGQGKEFLIIDGQQRFATLTLLLLAAIRAIEDLAAAGIDVEDNRTRVALLRSQYIGQRDPASLQHSSKLFLNENNNDVFQSRLVQSKDPVNPKKLPDSDRLLWEAYGFFREKMLDRERFGQNGQRYASFLGSVVGELMMFIQITVEDELNAYTVFETLNSRGVDLTATDLLKNYLFSQVAASPLDLGMVKAQWKKVVDVVGLREFPTFLRYYLMGTRRTLSKDALFKEIKDFVQGGQAVFALLDNLERHSYYYAALDNGDDDFWEDPEERKCVGLLKLFRVAQWKPLAMMALERLDRQEFKRLLRNLVSLSYRYNVISRLQTNEMEKVYSKAAIRLHKGEIKGVAAVLQELRPLFVSDEEFRNRFSDKQFRPSEKKLLRYTLYELEAREEGGHHYGFEEDRGSLEHILPESHSAPWEEAFDEEAHARHLYRLGNITLLETSRNNKGAADKGFEEKREVYEGSKYALARWVATRQEWTPRAIRHRQEHLAKLACAAWPLP